MTVIFPDPLADEQSYLAAIRQLNTEIEQLEQHLGRLKRLRGIRTLQLEQLQEAQDLKQR